MPESKQRPIIVVGLPDGITDKSRSKADEGLDCEDYEHKTGDSETDSDGACNGPYRESDHALVTACAPYFERTGWGVLRSFDSGPSLGLTVVLRRDGCVLTLYSHAITSARGDGIGVAGWPYVGEANGEQWPYRDDVESVGGGRIDGTADDCRVWIRAEDEEKDEEKDEEEGPFDPYTSGQRVLASGRIEHVLAAIIEDMVEKIAWWRLRGEA